MPGYSTQPIRQPVSGPLDFGLDPGQGTLGAGTGSSVTNPAATPATTSPWYNPGDAWNPMQYATNSQTQSLINQFGGTQVMTAPSSSAGPFVPQQNLISFGNGNPINAGLASIYQQNGTPDWLIAQRLAIDAGGPSNMTFYNNPSLASYDPSAPTPNTPQQVQLPQQLLQAIAGTPGLSPQQQSQVMQSGTPQAGGTGSPSSGNAYGSSGLDFGSILQALSGLFSQQQGQQSAPGVTQDTAMQTPGTDTTQGSTSTVPGADNPDQALANQSGMTGYLEQLVKSGGLPIDQLPAWQSMVNAMARQQNQGSANLAEQFGASGNRFSSSFGSAAADYQNQATLSQQALLGQMSSASQESAMQRLLSGGSTLAGIGANSTSQLASQSFQAQMQQQQQALQAALQMFGGGSSAASQLASQGATAGNNFLSNAVGATNSVYGTENQAAMAEVMRQLQLQQMGMSGASSLSNLWQSNLGLGNQIGTTQYGVDQSQINNAYQEWLRTQPQYSNLLPYFSQAAYSNPQTYYPQFQPSQLGSLLGGIGGLAGGTAGILNLLYNMGALGGG